MKEIIVTGATIDEAVANGCQSLGIALHEAEYEVIEEPKNGLFFRKPAKVRVYFDDIAADDEDDDDDELFDVEEEEEEAGTDDEEAQDFEEDEESFEDEDADEDTEEENEEVTEEEAAEASETAEVSESVPENYAAATEGAVAFLTDVLSKMGVRELEVTSQSDGERTILNINGNDDDLGVVIGHRGDTLTALQYLVSLAANNCCKGYFKVSLNVKNFREKRERTLENVASKTAYKATKLQKNIALEPMSPYERSIIHTAVQGIEGVTSWSVGENERRHVVIGPIGLDEGADGIPAKYAKVGGNRGGRGGYGRSNYGRGGYSSSRGGRGGYNGNGGRGGYRRNYRDDRGGYRDNNRGYRDSYSDTRRDSSYENCPVTRTKSNYESGFTYGKIDLNAGKEEK